MALSHFVYYIYGIKPNFAEQWQNRDFNWQKNYRTYISKYGINDFNEEHLQKVGLTLEELKENFTDRKDIVKAILEHERRCFEEIFNEYNFEGWNAIDIMLIVSDEINNRFFNVSHSFTIMLSKAFPGYFRRTYANAFRFYLWED